MYDERREEADMLNNSYDWLNPFEEMVDWTTTLTEIPDEQWLEPMAEGKWSIGEVISHFYFWDRFIYEERLLKLSTEEFGKADSIEMNQKAWKFAKSGVSKIELLNLFINSRKEICNFIRSIAEDRIHEPFTIGETQITLPDYVAGMIEHDQHHRSQIEVYLRQKSQSL